MTDPVDLDHIRHELHLATKPGIPAISPFSRALEDARIDAGRRVLAEYMPALIAEVEEHRAARNRPLHWGEGASRDGDTVLVPIRDDDGELTDMRLSAYDAGVLGAMLTDAAEHADAPEPAPGHPRIDR